MCHVVFIKLFSLYFLSHTQTHILDRYATLAFFTASSPSIDKLWEWIQNIEGGLPYFQSVLCIYVDESPLQSKRERIPRASTANALVNAKGWLVEFQSVMETIMQSSHLLHAFLYKCQFPLLEISSAATMTSATLSTSVNADDSESMDVSGSDIDASTLPYPPPGRRCSLSDLAELALVSIPE